MADATTPLQALRDEVARFVADREWERFHHPKELAISLVLESTELLELFQWSGHPGVEEIRGDAALMQHLRDELADVLAYVAALANALDIDLADAFTHKMRTNADKYPPELVRGRATKYTDLDRPDTDGTDDP